MRNRPRRYQTTPCSVVKRPKGEGDVMRLTRRDFFTGSASAVAGGYWLFPGLGLAEPVPDKFDGTAFKLAAPEPNAKSGGVLRMGIPNRPPHFDIHQSGTFFNLGAQGLHVRQSGPARSA